MTYTCGPRRGGGLRRRCPECNGRGWNAPITYPIDGLPEVPLKKIPCDLCKGAGEVD